MKQWTVLSLALICGLCACSDSVVQSSSVAEDSAEDERSRSDTALQTGDADVVTDLTRDTNRSDEEGDLAAVDSEDDADHVENADLGDSSGDLGEGDSDAIVDGLDGQQEPDLVVADANPDQASDSDGPVCPLGCFTEEDDVSPGVSRPVALTCNACRPAVNATSDFPEARCGSDADCCDGDNGRCVWGRGGPFCSYDRCFQDSDCGDRELCACDGARDGGNACIEAGCYVDAECGDYKCMPSLGGCGHYFPPVGYYCHTAEDLCQTDDDCTVGDCRYNDLSGYWACSDSECVG